MEAYTDRDRLRAHLRSLQSELENPDTPSFRRRDIKARIYQIAETLIAGDRR